MACVSIEVSFIMLSFAAVLILLREYQHRKSINSLKNESDELRNSVYALQKEEKSFRERDFRKLLNDFNKLKERTDELESENVKLKRDSGKKK